MLNSVLSGKCCEENSQDHVNKQKYNRVVRGDMRAEPPRISSSPATQKTRGRFSASTARGRKNTRSEVRDQVTGGLIAHG